MNATAFSANKNVVVNITVYNDGAIDLFLDLKESLQNMYVHSEFFFEWSNAGNTNLELEIMNRTIDACKFFRDVRYEPILQMIYKSALEFGNFPTKCPIPKV